MNDSSKRFVDLMGQHLEEDGVPRTYGRLLGVLLLNPEPRALEELADQLQVSKGSISSNARALEGSAIAERVTMPGDRRDFYQLSDDFVQRVFLRQIERQRLLIDRLEMGREAAGEDPPHVRERFDQLIEYLRDAIAMTEELLSAGSRRAPR
jgi:DNA-binding transcriptional regulator GbsR (MarR family)